MNDLRQAAQQALEALTAHADLHSTMYLKMDAIAALRAALVEPVQERDLAHEADMRRHSREQLRLDCMDEEESEHFCDTHCTWADHAPGCVMEERNFCPRCGKRASGIHTCTPPHDEHFCDTHCTWADHAPGCVRAELVQEPDPWGAGYEAGYAAGMEEVQAEPVQKRLHAALAGGCDHCNHPLYAAIKCRVCGRVTSEHLTPGSEHLTPGSEHLGSKQMAEPVQEPYAWMSVGGSIWRHKTTEDDVPLYTAPRKPLAEWQINDLMSDIDPEDRDSWSFRQGVYAAEKHHGVRK